MTMEKPDLIEAARRVCRLPSVRFTLLREGEQKKTDARAFEKLSADEFQCDGCDCVSCPTCGRYVR